MNRKVRKTFIGAFLATSLFIGVNSVSAVTIKETTSSEEGVTLDKIDSRTFIIGATKFKGVTLTAGRAIKATDLYAKLNKNNADYKGANLYYYIAGTWYAFDDDNNATEIKDEAELAKLNEQTIYYVNNEEKVLDIEYSKDLEEGYTLEFRAGKEKLEYVDGKIKVPATVQKVEVYAVKETGESKVETKLDEFSKTSMDASEFKTKSSLGSITYGDAKDASKITIDKINWVKAKEGKASGYYATVNIIVPEVYKNNYSNAKYYIDELGDEEEPTDLTEEALTQELTFDSKTMSHTITVIWAEGNTQVFTVEAKELSAKDGGTISFGKTSSASELTIDNVEWYKAGEKGADAGNYATVTIGTNDYAATILKDDENATYYVDTDSTSKTSITSNVTEITLKFDSNTLKHTITVEWEKGNVQVFTVTAKANGLVSAPAGTLTNDKDTANNDFTFDSKTNTATINGDIKWYSKGETTDYGKSATTAGNFKSVIINALGDYASSSSVNVKVYNGATKLSEETWNPSTSDAKYSLALNFAITKEYKIEVTWEKGNVQTFTIKLGEKADVIAAPAGTITDGEENNISASALTISKEIKYSKAVTIESPKAAGNYANVTINVPKEYQGKQVIVKIGENSDTITTAGTTIVKELNFATSKEYTIEVTWEEGNVQTFTVKATNVEATPAGTIAVEGLTLANGKLSGTVNYVKGEGNVITYVIKAPDAYDDNVQAKITIAGYYGEGEKLYSKEYEATFADSVYSLDFTAEKDFAYNVITIEWENGNTQEIKVAAGENLVLAAEPNYVESVKIVAPQVGEEGMKTNVDTILVNENLQLEVKITAVDSEKEATNKDVVWSSSDEDVATVDATGNVTAVGYGDATITVKSKEDSSISNTYTIHVKYPAIVNKSTDPKTNTVVEDNLDSYKKIVKINLAAEGGSSKGFTYSYSITKSIDNDSNGLGSLDEENNVLTITITDKTKTYTVKYTITDKESYAENTKVVEFTI